MKFLSISPSTNPKYFITHVRDKFDRYIKTLNFHGFEEITPATEADFILLDNNYHESAIGTMRRAHADGKPVFKLPHGARADLFWDFIFYNIVREEDVTFVFGPGQKKIYEKANYGTRIETIGFPWATIKPFQHKTGKRLLFAPIHGMEDSENRIIVPLFKEWNRSIMDNLRQLKSDFDIVVYLSAEPEKIYVDPKEEGIEYIHSDLKLKTAIEQIDKSDFVLAHETFAHIAIARGVPTLMFDDHHIGWHGKNKKSKFWPHYHVTDRYPLNWLTAPNKHALIEAAVKPNPHVDAWKEKYIGTDFDENRFIEIIEEYL